MRNLYTLVIAACTCIAAAAASPAHVQLTQYTPDPLSAAAPARAASLAADDASYTEWESLGTATLTDGYDNILLTFNSYNGYDQEPIVFTNTTEVMVRHLVDDADAIQFKFVKFLGFNDMVADYSPTTGIASIMSTPTGIPVPEMLRDEYNCESIDFQCTTISYSEVRKVFMFSNPFFLIYSNLGFYGSPFNAQLPDANPEIGFGFTIKEGGYKSTDSSITLGVRSTGIDHLRYIIRFHDLFKFADIADVSAGNCEYLTATDVIKIEYTKGYGYYRLLALAFDANDKYMGIYNTANVFSNLPPEGTWQPIGRGIWHHPDATEYPYYDYEKEEMITIQFPADKMQWEVDIEKRTDTDREMYRVVNPYSPSCALAETFNNTLDLMYQGDEAQYRPDAFRTDDTFWFVFDVTEPGNITYQGGRPNGAGNAHFMSTAFYEPYEGMSQLATFTDGVLRLPHYSINDLVIELPDTQGIDDITADGSLTDSPAEYFDLQGRPVTKPARGLYIMRRAGRCTKISVK